MEEELYNKDFKDVELNFDKNHNVNENKIKILAEQMSLNEYVSNNDELNASELFEELKNKYNNFKLNIKKVIVGMLDTNCYIVEKGNECLVIDPGDEFEKIKDSIDQKVVGILLTHRHFDHVGALEKLIKFYNTSVYDRNNLEEGLVNVGNFEFFVRYNPGHTMDSISFIIDNIMFSGDFVFEGTIGRWDLGGDYKFMQDSIKELLNSKIDYVIYPGHGNKTTLNKERVMLESYLK